MFCTNDGPRADTEKEKCVHLIEFGTFSFPHPSEGLHTKQTHPWIRVSASTRESGKLLSPGAAPDRKTLAAVLRNTSRLTQGQRRDYRKC